MDRFRAYQASDQYHQLTEPKPHLVLIPAVIANTCQYEQSLDSGQEGCSPSRVSLIHKLVIPRLSADYITLLSRPHCNQSLVDLLRHCVYFLMDKNS